MFVKRIIGFALISLYCDIKVGLSPFKKFAFIYFNERPLKIMTCFLLHIKSFIRSGDITFLSGLFGFVENRLNKKALVNFKTYDVTDWTTNNYNIHILPNISRSKGEILK